MADQQSAGDDRQEILQTAAPQSSSGRPIVKIVGVAVGLVVLFFLGRELGGYVPRFAEWVEGLGIWGPTVYAAGYAVATVAFVPGSILTMAAGAIFGLWEGTLIVFCGATVGTALAFLLSRYVARSAVERKLRGRPRFGKLDRAVSSSGLKIVFLMRLSPVFPYNLLNYALGLTSVRFVDYVIASLGMLPGTFLYVYYGKVLGNLAAVTAGAEVERGIGQWVLIGVGLVATIVVTTLVTRIARRALAEEVDEELVEEPPQEDSDD